MTEKSESPLEKQKRKTIDMIDQEQVKNDLGKSDLDEELEDASEDQDQTEDPFTEEVEGKIAPLSKAGSEEIDRSAIDERFSREHPIDEQALRANKAKKGFEVTKVLVEDEEPDIPEETENEE